MKRRLASAARFPRAVRVCRRAEQETLAGTQLGAEFVDRLLMLGVPGIEERNQHVGVERY